MEFWRSGGAVASMLAVALDGSSRTWAARLRIADPFSQRLPVPDLRTLEPKDEEPLVLRLATLYSTTRGGAQHSALASWRAVGCAEQLSSRGCRHQAYRLCRRSNVGRLPSTRCDSGLVRAWLSGDMSGDSGDGGGGDQRSESSDESSSTRSGTRHFTHQEAGPAPRLPGARTATTHRRADRVPACSQPSATA